MAGLRPLTMPQTTIDSALVPSTAAELEADWNRVHTAKLIMIENELLWLRHEWEDNKRDLFDLNELIGRLAAKIEEWVGVAEE